MEDFAKCRSNAAGVHTQLGRGSHCTTTQPRQRIGRIGWGAIIVLKPDHHGNAALLVVTVIVLLGLAGLSFAKGHGIIAVILAGIVIALTSMDQKKSGDSIDSFFSLMLLLMVAGVGVGLYQRFFG